MTAKKIPSSRPKPRTGLPAEAKRFLRDLAVTHKKSTVKGYTATLNAFYTWMKTRKISLRNIKRDHITEWFSKLAADGLGAGSRAARTIHLRIYLLWLSEEGLLPHHPFALVRSRDIPKLPQYLPKPLPPEVDTALTARLEKSENRHRTALLLMRKTGIRIGELRALPQHCIVTGADNRRFLKVPLGKLDNERLVPLDDAAVLLVQRLQQKNAHLDKQFLLENDVGRIPCYHTFAKTLSFAARGLPLDAKITTHRLRHTFATELLNAGMSVLALMKILGHRSYRMTLRYAAVTPKTIADDYFTAISHIQDSYAAPRPAFQPSNTDPIQLLQDLIRILVAASKQHPSNAHTLDLIIKRTRRLHSDISNWTTSLQARLSFRTF